MIMGGSVIHWLTTGNEDWHFLFGAPMDHNLTRKTSSKNGSDDLLSSYRIDDVYIIYYYCILFYFMIIYHHEAYT